MNSVVLKYLLAAITCVLSIASADTRTTAASTFGKVDRVVVGGAGGWDLLAFHTARQHLFISRGDRVQVFDATTGKIIRDIHGTSGVHGISLAEDLGLGFTSNGQTNSVTVFELESLNVVDEIKGTGENPDAILYDATSKRVFTFNARSQNVTVINAVNKSIVTSIALPGQPELAVLDGKGHIFVNLEDKNAITRIDIASSTVSATWLLDHCESPTGLAIDVKHTRLFSVCENHKMVVTDAGSGKAIAEVDIGGGPDGVVFDAKRGLVISSNGEGSLSVIHEATPNQYVQVATIPTQKGARTITLDEVHHVAYLVSAEFGSSPPVTADKPQPRPSQIPGTFSVLAVNVDQQH